MEKSHHIGSSWVEGHLGGIEGEELGDGLRVVWAAEARNQCGCVWSTRCRFVSSLRCCCCCLTMNYFGAVCHFFFRLVLPIRLEYRPGSACGFLVPRACPVNCTFADNSADQMGGAIYFSMATNLIFGYPLAPVRFVRNRSGPPCALRGTAAQERGAA